MARWRRCFPNSRVMGAFPQPPVAADRHRAGARGAARPHARAAAAGVPFVLLAQGLLRAPPPQGRFGRATPPCLSALVLEISGPPAPADVVTPGGLLENRGWETPALLARAALARRALAAARVGGEWWHGGAAGELPAGNGSCRCRPRRAGGRRRLVQQRRAAGRGVLAAMLDQALAENPADRVVVLAPGSDRAPAAAEPRRGGGARRRDHRPPGRSLGAPRPRRAGLQRRRRDRFSRAARRGAGDGLRAGVLYRLGRDRRCRRRCRRARSAGLSTRSSPAPAWSRRATATRSATSAANFDEVLAIARRLAPGRRGQSPHRGLRRDVVLEAPAHRRFRPLVGRRAGVPPHRRRARCAARAGRIAAGSEPRAIAGWASRLPAGLAEAAARHGVPLIRVEDGFIRSVGLGSDFLPPASLVFDRAACISIRACAAISNACCARRSSRRRCSPGRERLAARLVDARHHQIQSRRPAAGAIAVPPGRRCILVPGQVEDDLSIRFGGRRGAHQSRSSGARCAPPTPTPSSFTSRTPTCMAGHRKGAVPEARRAALPIASCRTARPPRCWPSSTSSTR